NEYLPVKTLTVYDANGNVNLKSKFYGYDSTRDALVEYLTSLYPDAVLEGYSNAQSNLRNLRETL
ncbi:MAG: hypothetical protein J5750_02815, partial [Clostridiales bacterium]|nr:hypothetical protein [Clostridiales bacterium]